MWEIRNFNSLFLEVTEECNLMCKYCYYGEKENRRKMSPKVIDRVINRLIDNESRSNGIPSITFFGGEPLLNFSLIKYCIDKCRRSDNEVLQGTEFKVVTNGMLLTEEIVNYFNKEGVYVTISLDGNKTQHDYLRKKRNSQGSFEAIYRNLAFLHHSSDKIKKRYAIRPTVTKTNKNITALFNFFKDLGVRNVTPGIGFMKEDPDNICLDIDQIEAFASEQVVCFKHEIEQELNFRDRSMFEVFRRVFGARHINYSCAACKTNWAIDISGQILPCHRFFGEGNYVLGSVYKEKIDQAIINEFNVSVDEDENCSLCAIKYFCGGVCRFLVLVNEKKNNNAFCKYAKSVIIEMIKFEKDLAFNNEFLYKKLLQRYIIGDQKEHTNKPTTNEIVMNTSSLNKTHRHHNDVKLIKLDNEGLLFKGGEINQKYIVNTTAMAIWQLIDGDRSATKIAQVIASICNVPFDDIKEDIYQQLATFQELGFIEEVKENA